MQQEIAARQQQEASHGQHIEEHTSTIESVSAELAASRELETTTAGNLATTLAEKVLLCFVSFANFSFLIG